MKKLRFGEPRNVNKEALIDEFIDDKDLNEFIMNNDLDSSFIEENLSTLLNFKIENDHCKSCAGLNNCAQITTGYQPVLKFEDGHIKTYYRECPFYARRQEINAQEKRIDALHMPKMILEARLEDYDFSLGQNRTLIFNKVTNFVTKYLKGDPVKGMYFHGEYQKGKTYTLAALANELSKHGVQVVIAYYPDVVREFKSRLSTGDLEQLVSKLKLAEILMLDDIGGESGSTWVRDEILGPILQYRLLDRKPTFFTSNVAQKDLMVLMTTNNQNAEIIKAARIDARIKTLSDEYKM